MRTNIGGAYTYGFLVKHESISKGENEYSVMVLYLHIVRDSMFR
jgi:hypothetical protein